jgi:glycosyltransferase involved in cell wall biosynthesis
VTRTKVAFVLPSLHGGGAERAAVLLLNNLPQDAYEPVLYLFAREGAYLDHVAPHVRTIIGRRGRVARLLALRRFVADERVDVVVSFLSHFTTYLAVRTAAGRPRFVISQQTPLSAFLQDADYHWRRPVSRRVFETVARAIYPRVDLVVATSHGVANDLVRRFAVKPEQIVVVPNPVDLSEVERRSGDEAGDLEARDASAVDGDVTRSGDLPLIVTAGRLADAKNLPLLVDALQVLASRLAFRAWILGQGELESDLRRRLAAAGLEHRVRLLGFRANPWREMARADLFVLTSRYEGFGNVLIEAMACGLPVVATASEGTRDIVVDGLTGYLVERHEPEAVAGAIERLLTDVEARARFATAARERARMFAVPAVIERFTDAIRRIAAPRSVS